MSIVAYEIADDIGVITLNHPPVNEGMKILEEGIAQRPGDIDVIDVFGYGFPAHKGGPIHLADAIGLKKVYDTICDFRDTHGEALWTPSALLEQLVRENKTLSQWATEQA